MRQSDVMHGMTTTQQMAKQAFPQFYGGGLMEGNFRDEDGVDRVKEPPADLIPILLVFKDKVVGEGIDLTGEFQGAGASCYGTMSKGQFCGQLVKTFKRCHFTDELLYRICLAYGTGLQDPKWGGNTEIAWMDFCEDISKVDGNAATMSLESAMGAYGGKSRDADGTIDRVPDPPEKLLKWLLVFKAKNKSAGIDLMFNLRQAGASPNGTMAKRQFLISLKHTYKEFSFSEQLLYSLAAAYGCGDPDRHEPGTCLQVAWRDLSEDIYLQDLNMVDKEND